MQHIVVEGFGIDSTVRAGRSFRGHVCVGWRNALAQVRLARAYGWIDTRVRGASFRDLNLASHNSGGLSYQTY